MCPSHTSTETHRHTGARGRAQHSTLVAAKVRACSQASACWNRPLCCRRLTRCLIWEAAAGGRLLAVAALPLLPLLPLLIYRLLQLPGWARQPAQHSEPGATAGTAWTRQQRSMQATNAVLWGGSSIGRAASRGDNLVALAQCKIGTHSCMWQQGSMAARHAQHTWHSPPPLTAGGCQRQADPGCQHCQTHCRHRWPPSGFCCG